MFKSVGGTGARAGLLTLSCGDIPTPTFSVSTIRGAAPHLTPDNYTAVPLATLFMEDFFDPAGPLVVAAKKENLPLNSEGLIVAAQHPDGKRNTKANTNDQIGLHTFQGLQMVQVRNLAKTISGLGPDLVIVPHDAPFQSEGEKVGNNRVRKMQTRSLHWFKLFEEAREEQAGHWPLLASITPELNNPEYLNELGSRIGGVYLLPSDSKLASRELAIPEEFSGLRVCGSQTNVFEVLELIQKGVDVFYGNIDTFSDAGQALMFQFDCSAPEFSIDLNESKYETDMTPLPGSKFSKAYIHHLLNAREMTAQVALQMYNLRVLESFFADVRECINDGTFEAKAAKFAQFYRPN